MGALWVPLSAVAIALQAHHSGAAMVSFPGQGSTPPPARTTFKSQNLAETTPSVVLYYKGQSKTLHDV